MKKIAVLGPKGTYCDLACSEYFKDKIEYETLYFPSILKAGLALDDCDFAVLPFENTLDGFVLETLDLIISKNYKIVGQVDLDIDFAFVSNAKNINEVKTIYSQFKAYGQCINFITENYFNVITTQSNIESLNNAIFADASFGAIVPNHTLKNHKFNLEIEHVADSSSNKTRFFILSKEEISNLNYDTLDCSIVIKSLEDRVGMLYEILGAFQKRGINLCAIMSRPNKIQMGKYIFYFEFEVKKDNIESISMLKKELDSLYDVQILGIYNKL